jgi:hypothetical protein
MNVIPKVQATDEVLVKKCSREKNPPRAFLLSWGIFSSSSDLKCESRMGGKGGIFYGGRKFFVTAGMSKVQFCINGGDRFWNSVCVENSAMMHQCIKRVHFCSNAVCPMMYEKVCSF